jgi:hypothetical protein
MDTYSMARMDAGTQQAVVSSPNGQDREGRPRWMRASHQRGLVGEVQGVAFEEARMEVRPPWSFRNATLTCP